LSISYLDNTSVELNAFHMTKTLKKYILLISFLFISGLSICLAQGPPDGGGDDEDPDAGIPIDGGVSFLAAAGVAYGTKKILENKNRNKSKEEIEN
jgi:hypothetical protein